MDHNIEDQPEPALSPEEIQASFQGSVNKLGEQLMLKFKLSGNVFNALELELKLMIQSEQLNVLTKIIQSTPWGAQYSDVALTQMMANQVELLAKTLGEELAKAPRIALASGAPPARLNGSKH